MPAVLQHDETGDLYHETCVDVEELALYSPADPVLDAVCKGCGDPLVEGDPEVVDEEESQ